MAINRGIDGMTCPACGSDDWKAASLVYQEGLTNVDTATKSVGLGVGGGHVGLGIGSGKTKGVHQTVLSKQAELPSENSWRVAFIMGAVVTAILGLFASFWWLISVLFIVGVFATWSAGAEAREKQVELYNKKRVCQRCGHIYYAI